MNRLTEIIDTLLQEEITIKTVLISSTVIIAGIAITSVLRHKKNEK